MLDVSGEHTATLPSNEQACRTRKSADSNMVAICFAERATGSDRNRLMIVAPKARRHATIGNIRFLAAHRRTGGLVEAHYRTPTSLNYEHGYI